MILRIQDKIRSLAIGTEFDVKTLMGDDWKDVSNKQSFGREFKKALAEGRLAGIAHDRLDNSPRRDVYNKT